MIETINLADIQHRFYQGDFKVLKMNTGFQIDQFKKTIDSYMDKFGTMKKDGYENYKAIALQYFDENNRFFDSIMSTDYVQTEKKIFFKKNELALELQNIYDTFNFIRLTRGRVIIADPGFKMTKHVDGSHINTLHIPITTNLKAAIVIDEEEFHLPADGSAYLINATIPHFAFNHSQSDSRMHITFPIGPPSFKKWKRSQIDQLHKYFEMMKMDMASFDLDISDD